MKTDQAPFENLTKLFDAMRRHFRDSDSKATADRAIRKLRQESSEYSTYHTIFVEYIIELD